MNHDDERWALVTGAAGGIGVATVRRLVAEGWHVLAADLADTAPDGSAADTIGDGASVRWVTLDVTSPEQWRAALAEIPDGRLGALVNNAGIEGPVVPLVDYPVDAFDQVLAVNVRGVFLGTQLAAPLLAAGGGGAIVNLSSIAGLGATPNIVAYGASKHAVIGITKTAALELAPQGTRVNAICPSPVETRMMRSLEAGFAPDAPELVHEAMAASIPLARYAEPDEVAALIAFLVGPDAVFLTGTAVPLDGGIRAR